MIADADFVRFRGRKVAVKLNRAFAGRRQWVGRLEGATADHILVEAEGQLSGPVLARSRRLLDWWAGAAQDARGKGLPLSYDNNKGGGDRLLREVLDPDLAALPLERRAFRAGRSMRDVEPPVDLYLHEIED